MSTSGTPPVAELPGYPADSKDLDEKKLTPSLAAETKVAPVKQSHDIYEEDDSVDPVYHAKARVLGDAFQEIGMGKYQVRSIYSRNTLDTQLIPIFSVVLVLPHRFRVVLVSL